MENIQPTSPKKPNNKRPHKKQPVNMPKEKDLSEKNVISNKHKKHHQNIKVYSLGG